jgi:hypothetical protein
MTYKIRAGAPFDSDNIFNIPPTDAGPLANLSAPSLVVARLDGGSFTAPSSVNIDGGYIPFKGTATYDPKKTYGPTDIIT